MTRKIELDKVRKQNNVRALPIALLVVKSNVFFSYDIYIESLKQTHYTVEKNLVWNSLKIYYFDWIFILDKRNPSREKNPCLKSVDAFYTVTSLNIYYDLFPEVTIPGIYFRRKNTFCEIDFSVGTFIDEWVEYVLKEEEFFYSAKSFYIVKYIDKNEEIQTKKR